jgi:peroxiredoxin Q/BCP
MLKVGDKAPDFKVENQNGDVISSDDLKGQAYVLFFYPKASTPGCTAEACNLRDAKTILQEKGFKVLGVSADSVKRQLNFWTKQNLNYDLLADEQKQIIEAYGVWGPKKFMGKEYEGINRATFLVANDGLIQAVIQKVKTKDHANQILELLES